MRKYICFFIFLLFWAEGNGQSHKVAKDPLKDIPTSVPLSTNILIPSDKITRYVADEMQRQRLPNVSLGIVIGDSVRYEWDFGGPAMKGNYEIGSLTKSFTAMATLQLVEYGKVVLDTPVQVYLPWFSMAEKNVSAQISVRHLLNQTSGIPKCAGFLEPATEDSAQAEKIFDRYLREISLESAPGKAFHYSNMNYQLLGLIVTHAAEKSWSAYIRDNILTPLGMDSTYSEGDKNSIIGLVPAHQYWFGLPHRVAAPIFNKYWTPAGEIVSNSTDMCRYLQGMMRGGRLLDGDSLLSYEHLNLLLTPPFLETNYGMGWFVRPDSIVTPQHSGLNKSYSSAMKYRMKSKIGVVVLSNINSLNDATAYIADGVLDILEGREPTLVSPLGDMYSRYGCLAGLFLALFSLVKNLIAWGGQGFRFSFFNSWWASLWLLLSVGLLIGALFYIPSQSGVDLDTMWGFQPDYAFALCGVAAVGIVNAVIRAFVKWNRV